MREKLGNYGLYLAWIVAIVATGGSLYFSEVLGFIPCVLCWYQRIFMYPLVILLGIATYRQDKTIIPYVLPMCILGMCISLFHYLQQKIPALAHAVPCTQGVPCATQHIHWFGFITIPFLAFVAFTLISLILFIMKRSQP